MNISIKPMLKCENCINTISPGEYVWQVKRVDSDGHVYYSPACSVHCAEEIQAREVRKFKSYLSDVENQSFQKMLAEEYGKWC